MGSFLIYNQGVIKLDSILCSITENRLLKMSAFQCPGKIKKTNILNSHAILMTCI